MKHLWQWIPSAILCAVLGPAAAAVEVGDPIEAAQAELGQPSGTMQLGDHLFFMYPRGMVSFCDGLVMTVELEDKSEYTARIQVEAERLLAEQALAEERAIQRFEEGTLLKEEILSSEAYQAASASERVVLWKKFRVKYPGVDVAEIYLAELQQFEREAKLEQRIRDQERRIAQLEKDVQQAQQSASTVIRVSEPARVYYPVPYVIRNNHRVRVQPTKPCPPVNTPKQPSWPHSPEPVNRSVTLATHQQGLNARIFRQGTTRVIQSNGGFSYVTDSTSPLR